jgi:hypothetical protein
MAPTIETAAEDKPAPRDWIFTALAIWNVLLVISFPVEVQTLITRQGFYYHAIWFSLPTEMIGLYPHPGYLLAWLFNSPTWDLSGVPGFTEFFIAVFSGFLAFALFSRLRLAGFAAAATALLVSAGQFQRVHFLVHRSGWLNVRTLYTILDNAMATGAFMKLIASLISGLLGVTLLRVLCWNFISGKADATDAAPIGSESGQRTRQLLFGLLVLSGVMILILARVIPANLSEYFGERSGFSVLFQLLTLVPVVVATAGLWITGDRFYIGIATGYAILFPILLVGTWYLELANPMSPVGRIKAPVWIELALCAAILAGCAAMVYRSRNAGAGHQGKFSLGVIISLAYFAASLDACNMQGLLRN